MQFKTLPNVQAGGLTYSIALTDAYSSSRDNSNYGDHCYEKLAIRIATSCCDGEPRPLQILEVSLLHELLHAVDHVHDLDLDEKSIASLAQGLLQVLKQYGLKLIEVVDD